MSESGAPPEQNIPADLFDGMTARRRAVVLGWDDLGLSLADEHATRDSVSWAQLTHVDVLPEAIVLGRSDRTGWRLHLSPDAPADLLARLPRRRRFGRWIDHHGLGPSLALFTAASAAVVLAVVNAPGWLGPRVPMSWERRIGDDMVGDLSAHRCSTPASDAALATLARELDQTAIARGEPPVRIELINLGEVNAVALPGARVLVFDGLVQGIGSPDALAGVLGHEIGHVRKRHVMQAMLRQFGLSMVLGGYRSGAGNILGQFTALRFSREAESEADGWSRARLDEAAISPRPTARFFAALADAEPGEQDAFAGYLASHPDSAARARAFQAAFRPERAYRPALDKARFAAIVGACARDHKAGTS